GRSAPGVRHFVKMILLVARPTLSRVVAADLALKHDEHAGANVPVVHALPAIVLVVPQPRLALASLQHLLDTNEGDRAALLRRLQQRAVEVFAARRVLA